MPWSIDAVLGAGNEIRTRDPNLGKVVLYQLSYSRWIEPDILEAGDPLSSDPDAGSQFGCPINARLSGTIGTVR